MTKAEARALGLPRYNTGKPCKRGHLSDRWTVNGHCMECGRERSIAWRATEEGKEYDRAYRNARLDHINPQRRIRYAKNAEAMRVASRARYAKNPERAKATATLYYWKNREKVLKDVSLYQKANPHIKRVAFANRRARKKGSGGSFTKSQFLALLKLQKYKCAYCKTSIRRKAQADHIMPLALGGSNDIKNIQGVCPTCNMTKKAKHPIKFAQELGFLL